MPVATSTTRTARSYNALASKYDANMRVVERLFVGNGREWISGQARGEVLEIAVGTGRNLPFYPAGVYIIGQPTLAHFVESADAEQLAALEALIRSRRGD